MAAEYSPAFFLLGLGFNGFRQLDGGSQDDKSEKLAEEITIPSPKQLLLSTNPSFHVSIAWDSLYVYASSDSTSMTGGRWRNVVESAKNKLCEPVTTIEAESAKGMIMWTASQKMYIVVPSRRGDGEMKFTETEDGKMCSAFGVLSKDKMYALKQDGKICEMSILTAESDGNSSLQFGPAISTPNGVTLTKMACGIDHVLAVSSHGDLFSFGLNSRGQLGLGDILPQTQPTLVKALAGIKTISIACGHWHNLALSEFGDVYSWGWNEHGQLGHSTDTPVVALPTLIELPPEDRDDVNFSSIACGERHSAAVSDGGNVYVWGWNKYGQLGLRTDGDVTRKPEVLAVMDSKMKAVGVYCGHWNTVLVACQLKCS